MTIVQLCTGKSQIMAIADETAAGLGAAWNERRQPRPPSLRREDRAALLRYARPALIGTALAWSLAGLYLIVTPVRYVSKWTMILPGAGQSATMSLESIGQATTTASSPFGSVSLSPKVVYKEIADSDIVRQSAAHSLGITWQDFGRPRIKLIDETALMLFEISGPSAAIANRKALASIDALNTQLDALRKDELEKRSIAITLNLKAYKDQVISARQKITDIQVQSGLVSISQFNETVTSLAATSRRLTDLSAELSKIEQEKQRLASRIGVDAKSASIALRASADPAMTKVVSDYSEAHALHTMEMRRLGAGNPILISLEKRLDAARQQFRDLSKRQNLDSEADGQLLALMTNVSHQAELFQQLVRYEAQVEGKRREVETLSVEKNRLDDDVTRLSAAAAKLEDLKKDHLLAEAVYSSALARVDTSKSDIYGAYPILQILAPPTLPDGYEQPRRLYAFAGGMAGTLFALLAWGLACLHYLQKTRRRKKR
jgi:uncharacterized protein involved in exopolysaccharide biosynthesis